MNKGCLRVGLCALFAGLMSVAPAQAQEDPFRQWLEQSFRPQAASAGVSSATLNSVLSDVVEIPRVIELDRKQPEGTVTFVQYRQRVINQARIDKGREMMRTHASLLNEMGARYGVEPQYIVALWGIETSYGANTGGFDVINALATLAYEGRRKEFFTNELIDALKILDQGHIDRARMKGSWAGALGQNQFMPSSFHRLAVDGDGDGHKNIWGNLHDVFASTANYLARSGWKNGERWGREVVLPQGFSAGLIGLDVKKPLSEWQRLGLQQVGGAPIPVVEGMEGSLVAPDGLGGPVYLVYDNYRAIMKWNKSTYFATSVGLLANAISS